MLLLGKNIDLKSATLEDAGFILSLRVNEQLCRHISKVDNDIGKQCEWLNAYLEREKSGKEYYFIIRSKDGYDYGTVRLYDFIGSSFCWGSWILHESSPSYASIESALMLYEFAYYHIGFEKSHFDVRKDNRKVVAFHTRFGAKIVDEDELNYYFHFDKAEYENTRTKYLKFLPPCGIRILD